MAVVQARPRLEFLDKQEIQRIVREQNELTGFTPDPDATAERAQQAMHALGIRPEDNLFSRGVIAARNQE